MEVTRDAAGRPDASNERGTRRRGVRAEAARRVTAAGRRGPHPPWRPLPGNLIDRRGWPAGPGMSPSRSPRRPVRADWPMTGEPAWRRACAT